MEVSRNRDLEANVEAAVKADARVSIAASIPVTLLGNSGSRSDKNDNGVVRPNRRNF